jgi:hypothetical protein
VAREEILLIYFLSLKFIKIKKRRILYLCERDDVVLASAPLLVLILIVVMVVLDIFFEGIKIFPTRQNEVKK